VITYEKLWTDLLISWSGMKICNTFTQDWIPYKMINSCTKSTWYAPRQHSYNICKEFLSHNSWMKNLNFTNSCTINMNWNIYTISIQLKTTFFEKSVKTINSNNSTKFEVNWWRGFQFTARHTKNRLQFDE
jgi:hypothetical protein